MVLGEDFSIGYLDHDAKTVQLYIEESITFRLLTPQAAVTLRYRSRDGDRKPNPPAGAGDALAPAP
jgi:hypothetical protein